MSLPAELDFDRDREASPARMNRAMDFLWAQLRAAFALQPELREKIEEIERYGLGQVSNVLAPVYLQALEIGGKIDALHAAYLRDGVTEALLAQAASAADGKVAGLSADVDGRLAAALRDVARTYAPKAHEHNIDQVIGLSAALDRLLVSAASGAAELYAAKDHTHSIAKVTGLQAALAALPPAGGAKGAVLTKSSPNDLDFAWAPIPSQDWKEVASLPASNLAAVTFANIPSTFTDLMLVVDDVFVSNGGSLRFAFSADNANFSALSDVYFSSNTPVFGAIMFTGYRRSTSAILCALDATGNRTPPFMGNRGGPMAARCPGGISSIRLTGSYSFTTGSFTLLAR